MAHLSLELWTPRIRYGSPNSSVSRGLWTPTKWGFCSPLEQARSTEFEIAISRFDTSPARQCGVQAGSPRDTEMRRKSRLFAQSVRSPNSRFAKLEVESPKVSGLVREYSRFVETNAGDWFDHDCRPTVSGARFLNSRARPVRKAAVSIRGSIW
jgi:hypothetical protein